MIGSYSMLGFQLQLGARLLQLVLPVSHVWLCLLFLSDLATKGLGLEVSIPLVLPHWPVSNSCTWHMWSHGHSSFILQRLLLAGPAFPGAASGWLGATSCSFPLLAVIWECPHGINQGLLSSSLCSGDGFLFGLPQQWTPNQSFRKQKQQMASSFDLNMSYETSTMGWA